MPSPLLLPRPPAGNNAADVLALWHYSYAPPITASSIWYSTPGPTLQGVPTPSGLAIPIQPGATYRPGIKCESMSDAWKIYNSLRGFNTSGMVARMGDGWKTTVDPRSYQRIVNPSTWEAWDPDSYHLLTLDEVRTLPDFNIENISGYVSCKYDTTATARGWETSYILIPPWYIEKETGAVYLDLQFSLSGRYQQRISGQARTLLINARMGHNQYPRSGDQPALQREITWNTSICGCSVECVATYWCWAPISVPVPVITDVENYYKSIIFTGL